MNAKEDVKERSLFLVVEGERKARELRVRHDVRVSEVIEVARTVAGRAELEEILIEDEEIVWRGDEILFEHVLIEEFVLLHVATRGRVSVAVVFNGVIKAHEFTPSATMAKIIPWAMEAFGLEGDPTDLQLKLGDEVLPAGTHLGQVTKGAKAVRLSLVMKIKPQG